MSVELQELKNQKVAYEAQRQSHQQMFHQLNGAITVLDEMIKKLELEKEDKGNVEANNESAEVPAE